MRTSQYLGPTYNFNGIEYRLRGLCCKTNKYEYVKLND